MVIKILYQKYKVASVRAAVLRLNCKRVQVQGLKKSRLIITGDEDQGFVASYEVWTSPVI